MQVSFVLFHDCISHTKIQPAIPRCLFLVSEGFVGECEWCVSNMSLLIAKHLQLARSIFVLSAALCLSNYESGTKHFFSQREASQACSCCVSMLHDCTKCFMKEKRDIKCKLRLAVTIHMRKSQEQGLGEPEKADRSDSRALGYSRPFIGSHMWQLSPEVL